MKLMIPQYFTRAASALVLATASVLYSPATASAADAPAAPVPQPSSATKALEEIEAHAPKEWKDPAAIAASHARVVALVDSNVLQSGDEFRRAAALLSFHLNEYRIIRTQYELMLAAAAMGEEGAAKSLAIFYDQFMGRIGRPYRFDFGGFVQNNPEFAELDPAPACIQAVWRDPAAARAALAGASDNPEIKAIVDADQADRQGNWANRTPEERDATGARDKARNARMREIVAAGEVHTANDFARAGLVLQHSARFSGLRFAHELAVASMLLGDRSGGRWLVAASYDRMLLNVALEQRFGTQYGPGGPLPVDEAGICDNERIALGCPTLAQARLRQARGSQVVNKLTAEVIKLGNRIDDAGFGVKATCPAGWGDAQVVANNDVARSIRFQRTGDPSAAFVFYYRRLPSPNPTGPAEGEALLRKQAAEKEADRRGNLAGYTNRPGSFVIRQANGQSALGYLADYEKDGAKWSEYLVRILGKNSVGLLFINAPSDQIEALKPALDDMADTVELP